MAMYESFAAVYDRLMDNVPYDEWTQELHRILLEHDIPDGLVLDLGCGTGQVTRRLQAMGYDMIGADASPDMLQGAQEAEERRRDAETQEASLHPVLYLCQDMRQFELYGTVRAVVSVCDCLNYILEEDDLLQVFRLVSNYLDPDGIFLFDLNTAFYYEHELGENTFADVRDDCAMIWENGYDPGSGINEYDLTLFVLREYGLYGRFQETHRERAWDIGKISDLLGRAGLTAVSFYDGYSGQPAREDSRRVLAAAVHRQCRAD